MTSALDEMAEITKSKKVRIDQKKLDDAKWTPVKPRSGDIETKKFALVIQEKAVSFMDPRIGWVYSKSRIHIKNPTKHRYTYKVKCTNNDMFDIKGPIGFVDSEDSVDVEVHHCPGILIPQSGWHHFSVYYIKCKEDAQDYISIWKSRKAEGCKHVPILFPEKWITVEEEKKKPLKKETDEKALEKSMKKLEEQVKKLEAEGKKKAKK